MALLLLVNSAAEGYLNFHVTGPIGLASTRRGREVDRHRANWFGIKPAAT
ncbi:MAG: hypothetical protein H0U86_10485 [Chloroflexi bacterium]|nr:hypothetical protein [Chloroflexota bacterium]